MPFEAGNPPGDTFTFGSQTLWKSFDFVISGELYDAAHEQYLKTVHSSRTPKLQHVDSKPIATKIEPVRKRRKVEEINSDDIPSGCFIIAYDANLQRFIDKKGIEYGVQWEMARFVSTGHLKYEDISVGSLDRLKGPNSESAGKLVHILFSCFKSTRPSDNMSPDDSSFFADAVREEINARSPWTELDRERESRHCPNKALGCDGDDWYGGKVQFIAKLKDKSKVKTKQGRKPEYVIELEPPTLGPSCRFTRRFGSHSFLRLDISNDIIYDEENINELSMFLRQAFVIAGRIYRTFFSKDHSTFLYMTNEYLEGGTIVSPKEDSPDGRMSLYKFLEWHNPLESNASKSLSKWAARFALGLSNSAPGIRLDPDCIVAQKDECSPVWNGEGKLPSELDMSDGCGFANAPLLRRLRKKFEWDSFPTAIQCRIAGAKGLLLLHSSGRYSDMDERPKAWLRPSQLKIDYPTYKPLDDAMLVVDVLRRSHMKVPATLSAETIVCLAENGVPASTFKKLMHDGLDELVQSLTNWDGNDAMQRLFFNVAKVGAVFSQRRAREHVGEGRVKGFAYREDNAGDEDSDDDDDDIQIAKGLNQRSTAWWDDQVSGQPSTLEETCLILLSAGFTPRNCPVLAIKLKEVLRMAVTGYVRRFRILVPMSCGAFIVPDPFGVLNEGEIFIKVSGSEASLNGFDGLPTDVIQGDVLVTRHPCKVPSDVQKVKAVDHPCLRQYTNVVVFPIKGRRSLASMLGGGDYDGDRITAIWQPEIVDAFTNADDSFADPPPGISESFQQNTETVGELLIRHPPDKNQQGLLYELQSALLSGMKQQNVVGVYSLMHDSAVYQYGYFSEEAKRLAYMFCTCLDGIKAGMTVKPEVFKNDRAMYNKTSGPKWRSKHSMSPQSDSYIIYATRPKNLHKFIMDTIRNSAEAAMKKHMQTYDELIHPLESSKARIDEDLVKPYLEAKKNAESVLELHACRGKLDELNMIEGHVRQMRVLHRQKIKSASKNKKVSDKVEHPFTGLAIEKRQDMLRALSKEFFSGPKNLVFFQPAEVARVRASYAYLHDAEENKSRHYSWSRFPWDVAMRELCAIKAKAVGFEKTITRSFYEKMTIVPYARAAPRNKK